MYRVAPIMTDTGLEGGRVYRTCEISNRLCQMQLYRWSRSEDFVLYPGIGELFTYLISSAGFPSSKGHFGRTVINAVDYNPRKLKGVTKDNPKATQIYVFRNSLDLQYGLEYQICAWLRHFLNDLSATGSSSVSGPDMLREELDMLATAPWAEFHEIYVQPMMDINTKVIKEPNWRKLMKQASSGLRVNLDEDGIPTTDLEDESEPDIPAEPRGGVRSFGP